MQPLQPRTHLILTVLLLLGLAIAWIHVERIDQREHDASLKTRVSGELSDLRSNLESNLYYNIRVVEGLKSFVQVNPDLDQATWEKAVEPLLGTDSQLRNIAAAPNLVIALMHPVEGNEKAIGLDYRKNDAQFAAANLARSTGELVLAGPLDLVQGGVGIITRIPVFIDAGASSQREFWGLLSAVIDAEKLFEAAGLKRTDLGIEVAIRGKDASGPDGPVFFGREAIFDQTPVALSIPLPHGSWQIAAVPRGGWSQRPENIWTLRAILLLVCLLIVVPVLLMGRLIRELNAARHAANQANEAKSAFLSSMSHEIRTPMNGVLGMTQLLGETELDSEQKAYVEIINESGEALLQIINDILDFSRLDAKQVEIQNQPFDLNDVIRGVLGLLEPQANEKGLALSCERIDADHAFFSGDAGRIRQILINLIGNAIKFTTEGRVDLRVQVEDPDSAPQRIVRFEVEDTGIGIAPENTEFLFDRFVQADNSISRQFGGTGLGLAICRNLVDAMHGRIGVESGPGGGSLFWFELPLTEASRSLESSKHDECKVGERAVRSLDILVAEDVATNQMIARRMLENLGHRVEIASNGHEVLDALRRKSFDLVFMDVQMPEMDGLSATRAIRRTADLAPSILIIAMTANATDDDRKACLEAGMNAYISKPFALQQLRKLLETQFA